MQVLVIVGAFFRKQNCMQATDESENKRRCEEDISDLQKKEETLDNLIRQRQMELENLSENNSKYPFS